MDECSCRYCYHKVCFHPARGDGLGLGVPCDGCDTKDIVTTVFEDTQNNTIEEMILESEIEKIEEE